MQLSALDGDLMAVLPKEEGLPAARIVSQAGSRVPVNGAAARRCIAAISVATPSSPQRSPGSACWQRR